MSYEQASAGSGESPTYHGTLHWIGYVPAVVLFAAAAGFSFLPILGALFAIAGLIMLARHLIVVCTTEIVVTDRRVLFKTGFIRRNTVELSARKIEGVDIEQSILGRILNYGDLAIRGTGVGAIQLRNVARPLDARRALNVA